MLALNLTSSTENIFIRSWYKLISEKRVTFAHLIPIDSAQMLSFTYVYVYLILSSGPEVQTKECACISSCWDGSFFLDDLWVRKARFFCNSGKGYHNGHEANWL